MDLIPIWFVIPTVLLLVLIPANVGYQLGKRNRRPHLPEHPLVTTVDASLGLLAFILAFIFSIAAQIDDNRKQLVLEEANALRTAWRRADLLPQEDQPEVKQALRDYLRLRLAATEDTRDLPELMFRSVAIHDVLWKHCAHALSKDPSSNVASAFSDSVQQLTELHYRRVNAGLHCRIPGTVWLTLLLLTCIAMTNWGYQAGMAGGFRKLTSALIMLGFAALIALIVDLDRPQGGLMRVSQEALTEVSLRMN